MDDIVSLTQNSCAGRALRDTLVGLPTAAGSGTHGFMEAWGLALDGSLSSMKAGGIDLTGSAQAPDGGDMGGLTGHDTAGPLRADGSAMACSFEALLGPFC